MKEKTKYQILTATTIILILIGTAVATTIRLGQKEIQIPQQVINYENPYAQPKIDEYVNQMNKIQTDYAELYKKHEALQIKQINDQIRAEQKIATLNATNIQIKQELCKTAVYAFCTPK